MVRFKFTQSVPGSPALASPTTRFGMELGERAAMCTMAARVLSIFVGAQGFTTSPLGGAPSQRIQFCRGLQLLAKVRDLATEEELS